MNNEEIREVLDNWARYQIGDIVNAGEAALDEIDRLREALEFYATETNYFYLHGCLSDVTIDCGRTAHAALKPKEEKPNLIYTYDRVPCPDCGAVGFHTCPKEAE